MMELQNTLTSELIDLKTKGKYIYNLGRQMPNDVTKKSIAQFFQKQQTGKK